MNRTTAENVKNSSAIVARLQCRRQYWATRPLLRIGVFVLCFTLYSALGIGSAFAAQSSDGIEAKPAQSPEAALKAALEQWLEMKLDSVGEAELEYEFAVTDKRLSVPVCAKFLVDPQNRINASTLSTAATYNC